MPKKIKYNKFFLLRGSFDGAFEFLSSIFCLAVAENDNFNGSHYYVISIIADNVFNQLNCISHNCHLIYLKF